MSAKNNLLFITFDSCRYDTFRDAKTPFISRLGTADQRYSYASWTVPSHVVYLMGCTPHYSPKYVFASEVYKQDFANWSTRLNIPDISLRGFVPRLSLPAFLKEHGYRTNALVSMPVLNQTTLINQHFDNFELMDKHNDFGAMVDKLQFDKKEPSFYLLNTGETHYPYTLPGEKADDLPRLHGVHGVFKHMDDSISGKATAPKEDPKEFINEAKLAYLKDRQRRNVEHLDKLFEKLYDKVPENTYIMVTTDHGELFGEEGYFGHGPIVHEKVLEVFYVEGKKR